MKQHPVTSDHILSGIEMHPFVRQIVRSSHERIDGKGYPDGLEGEDIPLPARIVLVADAFDALASDRPYRPGRPVAEAMEELRAHVGTQFCPNVWPRSSTCGVSSRPCSAARSGPASTPSRSLVSEPSSQRLTYATSSSPSPASRSRSRW